MSPRRTPSSIAVLTALAIFTIPAAAEARTHRFAPSHEVTVTLELRKPTATGTLVRFARNQLTLTRRRSGVLELRATGFRAHRLAALGRRSLRVRMEASMSVKSSGRWCGRAVRVGSGWGVGRWLRGGGTGGGRRSA